MGILFLIGMLVFGLLLGTVVGMTAIGTGLIGTSGFILFGMNKFQAVGTIGLAGVFLMLSSVIKHYKNKNVNLRTAVFFSITAFPMSFICAQHKEQLNEYINLTYIIAIAIIISVITLVYKFFICKKPDIVKFENSAKTDILSVVLGLFIGFFIGATSISGSMIVITMMLILKMPEKLAIGTTSSIAIVSLVAASVAHITHGHVNWPVFAIFTPTVMIGGYFGAHFADKMPQKQLRIIILALLFIAAIALFFKADSTPAPKENHGEAATELQVAPAE
ncbi:MAG: sulfite exporter TauE/SafE family protein [Kiritimatiellae bacterium]|jgi:uncharacterized membrane protein YfcA|nr:sulfite exporter TauE/SafE family protein [Kiritimatiellia bacterium]